MTHPESTLQHADDIFHAAAAFAAGMRYIKSAPRFAFLGSATISFHLGPSFSKDSVSLRDLESSLSRRKVINLPRIPADCDVDIDMDPKHYQAVISLYQQLAGLGKLPRKDNKQQEREQSRSARQQPNQMLKGFRQGSFHLKPEAKHPDRELTFRVDGDTHGLHTIDFDIRGRGGIHTLFDTAHVDTFSHSFVRQVSLQDLSNRYIGTISVYRPIVVIFSKLLVYPHEKNNELSRQDIIDIRTFIDLPGAQRAKLGTLAKDFHWFLTRVREGKRRQLVEKVKGLTEAEAVAVGDYVADKKGWKKGSKQHTAAVQGWERFFVEFRGLFGLKEPNHPHKGPPPPPGSGGARNSSPPRSPRSPRSPHGRDSVGSSDAELNLSSGSSGSNNPKQAHGPKTPHDPKKRDPKQGSPPVKKSDPHHSQPYDPKSTPPDHHAKPEPAPAHHTKPPPPHHNKQPPPHHDKSKPPHQHHDKKPPPHHEPKKAPKQHIEKPPHQRPPPTRRRRGKGPRSLGKEEVYEPRARDVWERVRVYQAAEE